MSASPVKPIPASILTGFLGAGKTTLLNYILKEEHGYKFGIIVNEIGEVGIDGQLVQNELEEMVELNNGCICCSIRKDLIQGIQKLLKRGGFDYLLVETTGIAEPGPIAQTFLNIPQLQQYVRLDSIITVVDAEQIRKQMKSAETAREQIAMADFVLLNKVDLVDEPTLQETERLLSELNPHARVFRTDHSRVNLQEVLDMHAFDVDQKLSFAPGFLDETTQRHHSDIVSFAFKFDQPFNIDRFETFVQDLSENESVYRSKGILAIEGNPRRAVFHGVNNRFTVFWDRLWAKGEDRLSQLVFIGKDLDRERVRTGIQKCLS